MLLVGRPVAGQEPMRAFFNPSLFPLGGGGEGSRIIAGHLLQKSITTFLPSKLSLMSVKESCFIPTHIL